jgi:putative ABC transport system permease protein
MDTLLQNVRYAVRRLRNSPGFSAIVVITLALGIGANTAIFSVVNAVLLRPLPYREPERLVTIYHFYPGLNNLEAPVSAPGFRDYRDQTGLFQTVAVETGWGANLTGMGDPERLRGTRVTAQFFATLGITPQVGRTFVAEEDAPGKNHVVVLTYGLWQRLFAGQNSAVGKTMTINGEQYVVIGVMPQGMRDFWNRDTELWSPLGLEPAALADNRRTNEYLNLTGRLKPGITPERAQATLTAFANQLKQRYPDFYAKDWTLRAKPLQEVATGRIRPALLILLGAVGFVLLIACANVANLLLARAAARLKEVAIRTALGAQRAQLVKQLLTESVLLAIVGGVIGLGLAYIGVRALVAFNPRNLPGAEDLRIDGVVMLFTGGIAIVTGLIFGLVPALQTSRSNLQETLREGGRTAVADKGGQAVRRVLVVVEVALALTLLTGAGLLMKSFARIQGVEPGFDASNLLTFNLALPQSKYPSDTQQVAFFDQALSRLAATPGIRAVGATSVMPFTPGGWSTGSFTIEGYQPAKNQPGPWGDIRVINPDFFKALKVPLIKGRVFDERDTRNSPQVAVVDEELVRRYLPNVDPIGHRVTFNDPQRDTAIKWIEIVGVVGHTKHEGLDADARIQLYFPYAQAGSRRLTVGVRTAGAPLGALATVRDAVHAVDKDLPISDVRTMDDLISQSVGQRRLSMVLLGLFAGIALVLASIGIYGVMSYSVTQRSHELGVRMALGAGRSNVLGLVLAQGMRLALIGVAFGLGGAFALTRLMATQLYAVKPTDPTTFGSVAVLLTTIAAVAILVPAMRATRVDPVEALRRD